MKINKKCRLLEYIQKLERRIHNQRVALRQNWQIVEERANHRNTPLRSMWFDLVKKLVAENRELREKMKPLKIGKYFIIPYNPEYCHESKDSVYIYKSDGEGGEFKISDLEKCINKLWEEQYG